MRERAAVEEAIKEVLTHFRAEGLLAVHMQEQVQEHSVCAYCGRVSSVRQAMNQFGWRVYATNHQRSHLTLEQAVEA